VYFINSFFVFISFYSDFCFLSHTFYLNFYFDFFFSSFTPLPSHFMYFPDSPSILFSPSYGMDDRGVRVRVPVRSRILHVIQTGCGIHPTSYPMNTRGSFPGVKQQGRGADHTHPTNAEVKKTWTLYIYSPSVFMA
jgi:hypothetical protein